MGRELPRGRFEASNPDRRLVVIVAATLLVAQACSSLPVTPSASPGAAATAAGQTSPAATPRASLATPTQPPAPSSETLIGRALKAGRIDYDTSLLYRAYALFGDARLPAEYRGGGAREDLALFEEAREPRQPLAAGTADELAPFLVRPTDPTSVFNAPSATGSNSLSGAAFRPSGTKATSAQTSVGCDAQDWFSATSRAHPGSFKVWAQCHGDPNLAAADVYQALAMLDQLWAPETTLMGLPIPDTKDNDPAPAAPTIDVYLVLPLQCGRERAVAQCEALIGPDQEKASLAWTPADAPWIGAPASRKSSACIEIQRALLGTDPDLFDLTLAHEFFHVLQDAHNQGVQFDEPKNEYWFVEASAQWAESAFLPDLAPHETYDAFAEFQNPRLYGGDDRMELTTSVRTDDNLAFHAYAAFAWPYFVQQEHKDQGESIAQIWKNVEGKTTFEQFTDEIDAELTFREHFRDFAVRNVNQDLVPGDPVTPRYQELHPDSPFPLGTRDFGLTASSERRYCDGDPPDTGCPWIPRFRNYTRGDEDAWHLHALPADAQPPELTFTNMEVLPLEAEYYYFFVDSDVGTVAIDFSGLHLQEGVGGAASDSIDADAIVQLAGDAPGDEKWERRHLDVANGAKFCPTLPKDRVRQMYLVVSNHEKDIRRIVQGTLKVVAQDTPCLDIALTHNYSSTYNGDAALQQFTINLHSEGRFENGQWVSSGGRWELSGSGFNGAAMSDCIPDRQEHYTLSGAGTWLGSGPGPGLTEGHGVLTLSIGPDQVPVLDVTVAVHQTFSDSCSLGNVTGFLIGFHWPTGTAGACALDKTIGTPCTQEGDGPAPVPADSTGPFDLTGSIKITEMPPGSPGKVNITTDSVSGILGGPAQ